MEKTRGFLKYRRELPQKRPVVERVLDHDEVYYPFPEEQIYQQAARCMDCGVPFCHSGCPLGNRIPNWNDLVFKKKWKEAYEQLAATNNFPEFTGRICPAPCEQACVLGITDEPVTIEQIEQEIIEHAFGKGWVKTSVPVERTGKRVAVIGSGPAGLACADQLNKAGHKVTVLERDDAPGGLLRYGIPDFKLEKHIVERRIALMEAAGITFETGVHVGISYPVERLQEYDSVVLCIGATQPRDIPLPGRELSGIHFAWDYLWQQNKRVSGKGFEHPAGEIHAQGKNVIVIGGGDTGSDCVGTANRQGAASVVQFELMPMPPDSRPEHQPWPYYPMKLRTSTSHEEGVERQWSIKTKAFQGNDSRVTSLETIEVDVGRDADGRLTLAERACTEKTWPADLVLLAVGYTGPQPGGLLDSMGVKLNERGAIATNEAYATNIPGVFAAGDGRRGQSLVVWAISEGREAARSVDLFLSGHSVLPAKGVGDLPRR